MAAKSVSFLKYRKSLDVCVFSTFCHTKDLHVPSFRVFWPGHGRKREHKPLCFYSQGSITSKEAQFIYFYFFFNMAFSVLNNLWKLFGNSEHSSSDNAWNLKINGWWFRAWEIRVQNQAGFMVTSEIQKKKKKKSQTWSYDFQSLIKTTPGSLERLCVCIRIYMHCMCMYACMHMCVLPYLKWKWTFLSLYKEGRKSPFSR